MKQLQDVMAKALLAIGFFLITAIVVNINYIQVPHFWVPSLVSLALTGFFFATFIGLDRLSTPLTKDTRVMYAFIGAALILGLGLRLYWVFAVPTAQVSDFGRMWESAGMIAGGDFSRFQDQNYLHTYPHLVFSTLLYAVVYAFTGGSLVAMKLTNVLFSLATTLLVYAISKEMCGERKPVAFLIMAFNAPFIFFNGFLDTQNLAIPFFYAGILLYFKVVNGRLHLKWLVLTGICFALGSLFRSVGTIFTLALYLHFFAFYDYSGFMQNWRKHIKPFAAVASIVVVMFATTLLLNGIFLASGMFQKPTWDSGGNLILYINAGFNHESNGMWNQYDYDLLRDVGYDYELATIEAKRRLQERLADKDKVLRLVASKYRTQWGYGDFHGFHWSVAALYDEGEAVQARVGFVSKYQYVIQAYYSALLLLIIRGIVRRWQTPRKNPLMLYGIVVFIGFSMLHTLIEMQPRYGYIAMPMLTILAIASLDNGFLVKEQTHEDSL